MDAVLIGLLLDARRRLAGKGLFAAGASVSLRLPRAPRLLLVSAPDDEPRCRNSSPLAPRSAIPGEDPSALHAAIYALRPDVGAIVVGGGPFGQTLAEFDGTMPLLFDEQARHLGHMGPPATLAAGALEQALRRGGNTA